MATYEVYRASGGVWHRVPDDSYVAVNGVWKRATPNFSSRAATDAVAPSLGEHAQVFTQEAFLANSSLDPVRAGLAEAASVVKTGVNPITGADTIASGITETRTLAVLALKTAGDTISSGITEARSIVIYQTNAAADIITIRIVESGAVSATSITLNTYGAEGYLGGYAA